MPWFAVMGGYVSQLRDDMRTANRELESARVVAEAGAQAKTTFPSLIGAEGSRETLRRLSAQMEAALADLDDNAAALRALARLVVERDR